MLIYSLQHEIHSSAFFLIQGLKYIFTCWYLKTWLYFSRKQLNLNKKEREPKMQFNTQFQAHYLSLSINLAMVQKVARNGLKCWLNSSRLQCRSRSRELLYHACEASQTVWASKAHSTVHSVQRSVVLSFTSTLHQSAPMW